MKTSDLTTELILTAIHEVRGFNAWNSLVALGIPEKVIHSAYMREVNANRLEYGTSPKGLWLTPEGELFIGCSYESHDSRL